MHTTSLLIVQKTRALLSTDLLDFIKGVFQEDKTLDQIHVVNLSEKAKAKAEGDIEKELTNIRAGYGEFYIHRQDVFNDKSFPFTLQAKE